MADNELLCPLCPDRGPFKNRPARASHQRLKHDGATAAPAPAAELAAGTDPAVAQLQKDVKALAATVEAGQLATPADIPAMDRIIAHCEGGACKVHADAWLDAKARIVEGAYKAQTDDMIRDEATKRGLLPTSIVIKPMEPAKT